MRKTCRACKREKDECDFIAGKTQRVSSLCSACRRKKRAQHIRSYYRNLSPDKRHELTHKRRARNYGVRHEPYSRAEVIETWGGRCMYCGAPGANHVEHITPLSRGGEDVRENVGLACSECNLSKGSLTLAEWALRDFPPPF